MKQIPTIISLYDDSGNWSDPYRENGYNVIQYDIKKDGNDIRLLKALSRSRVRGILAAPPCTVFCRAAGDIERTDQELIEALACVDVVFRFVYLYRPKFFAIENPPGQLSYYIGKHRYGFQPFWFGDLYTKHTYLWGRFNRPAVQKQFYKSGNKSIMDLRHNAVQRSITPKGFAQAFFEANP